MKDQEIREEFFKRIQQNIQPLESVAVFEEVGILKGKSIADIIVFYPELFEAFEIKSAEDSTVRLLNQVSCYNQVFESISLITETNHVDKILNLVPEFWGIILAQKNESGVHFEFVREPQYNHQFNPYALAEILWKGEVIKILRSYGIKNMQKYKREVLWIKLVDTIGSTYALKKIIIDTLHNREGWKTAKFSKIKPV